MGSLTLPPYIHFVKNDGLPWPRLVLAALDLFMFGALWSRWHCSSASSLPSSLTKPLSVSVRCDCAEARWKCGKSSSTLYVPTSKAALGLEVTVF